MRAVTVEGTTQEVITDSFGQYRLTGVPAGTVVLVAGSAAAAVVLVVLKANVSLAVSSSPRACAMASPAVSTAATHSTRSSGLSRRRFGALGQ